jgi:hypothetical protein
LVEVLDALRLGVVWDADAEGGRTLVPPPEVHDLILVLLPVTGVGVGQPDIQKGVDVAGRHATVQGPDLRERRLHLVAKLLFEQYRRKVRDGYVLVPVDVTDGDRVLVATPTATLSSAAAPAATDEPDKQAEHERKQRLPAKNHLPPLPYFNAWPSIRDASRYCTATYPTPQALRPRLGFPEPGRVPTHSYPARSL